MEYDISKIKTAGLWIALILMYIYADIFSFYRTGYLEEVAAGYLGPLLVDQKVLLLSGMLMLIPILMIIVTLFVNDSVGNWINIAAGILYTAVGIGNLAGEQWLYYWLYGIVELIITVMIICIAVKKMRKRMRQERCRPDGYGENGNG